MSAANPEPDIVRDDDGSIMVTFGGGEAGRRPGRSLRQPPGGRLGGGYSPRPGTASRRTARAANLLVIWVNLCEGLTGESTSTRPVGGLNGDA